MSRVLLAVVFFSNYVRFFFQTEHKLKADSELKFGLTVHLITEKKKKREGILM